MGDQRDAGLVITFSTQSSKKARPVSLSLTKVHSSMKRMKIWVLRESAAVAFTEGSWVMGLR
ncbi:hypothetical protein EYF80_005782 [Liparis tanakae]|uniref:Uncharacterized protein n=1 Tax=Liparis tanakae TaxID=230148 RepID=A0A4Z2J1U2_9TELE|nr:hypothetical protein EYF80_005782 [Liparis tanakae]